MHRVLVLLSPVGVAWHASVRFSLKAQLVSFMLMLQLKERKEVVFQ